MTSAISDFAREILLESVPAEHVGHAIDVIDEPSDSNEIAIKSYSYEIKETGKISGVSMITSIVTLLLVTWNIFSIIFQKFSLLFAPA